jgi:extradiol dioxygenase family protein
MDLKLEVVAAPVTDVDKAKQFFAERLEGRV